MVIKISNINCRILGVTICDSTPTPAERRIASIYFEQWRELFWIGYLVIWFLNFTFVFLSTLEEDFAIQQNPFLRERNFYARNNAKRKPFGWKRYFLRLTR
jgi:hypothetical protein